MNQQPGLLPPVTLLLRSMQAIKRPVAARKRGLTTSSGQEKHLLRMAHSTQKKESLDVTPEKKNLETGNQEEIVWPFKMWWVRSGSPSPSCILEFILVWTVSDVPHLLWTISKMPCKIMLQVLETHIFLSPNLWLHQAPPDRCHGVGSAKLGEGPKARKPTQKPWNPATQQVNSSEWNEWGNELQVNANSSLGGLIWSDCNLILTKVNEAGVHLNTANHGWSWLMSNGHNDMCDDTCPVEHDSSIKEIWKHLRRKMTGGWQHSEMP